MYKLLAIDLDGTLLNSYGEVSKENKEAVKKAKEAGINVVLTSGRMSSSVRGIAEELEVDDYIISGNGALVSDLKNEKIIYNNCIPLKKALKVIKICDKNDIYYTINTEKYIMSKTLNYNLKYYYYENERKEVSKRTKINIVQDIPMHIKYNDIGGITKITISNQTKIKLDEIMKKLAKVGGLNLLEVSNISRKIIKNEDEIIELKYFYTEITKENVNKWVTLKWLARYLNIQPEEIAAIGDNINDYEMITKAGLRNCHGQWSIIKKEYWNANCV